jgi:hypothetical protein
VTEKTGLQPGKYAAASSEVLIAEDNVVIDAITRRCWFAR